MSGGICSALANPQRGQVITAFNSTGASTSDNPDLFFRQAPAALVEPGCHKNLYA